MTYTVGQRVWIFDVNQGKRGPQEGTVTKVGRKLVTVRGPWASATFRIETGQINSQYSNHTWIKTDEEKAYDERRAELIQALRDHGVRFDGFLRLSNEVLAGFLKVIEEHQS